MEHEYYVAHETLLVVQEILLRPSSASLWQQMSLSSDLGWYQKRFVLLQESFHFWRTQHLR